MKKPPEEGGAPANMESIATDKGLLKKPSLVSMTAKT